LYFRTFQECSFPVRRIRMKRKEIRLYLEKRPPLIFLKNYLKGRLLNLAALPRIKAKP
jgi:hypothetical protein